MSGWTPDQYYGKAKSYVERGLDAGHDTPLRAWWLHFAVEPLLRAVVARKHPVLLAGRDSVNALLDAVGEERIGDGPVQYRMTLDLVDKVIPKVIGAPWTPFLATRVRVLVDRRNSECHGPDAVFEGLPEGAWLPDFLRVAEALCDFLEQPLEDLVGEGFAERAREIAAEDDNRVRNDVERLIGEAKKRPLRAGATPLAGLTMMIRTDGSVVKIVDCPACGNSGELSGRPVHRGPVRVDDGALVQEATVAASAFRCPSCALRLTGGPQIAAADLEGTFEASEDVSAWETLALDAVDELERQGLIVVDPADAYGYQDE